MTPPKPVSKADFNTAIETAIVDFLKCGLSKKYDAFSVWVYERNEYDRYEISEDLLIITY